MSKLHEVVAIRKGVKTRTYSEMTEIHKKAQKADLYNGMTREFSPKDDDGETFPPESKKVQITSGEILRKTQKLLEESWDIEAAQEYGNLEAKADIVVDGQTILSNVPATFLLYLEKQLTDVRTFVEKMPTLDTDKVWAKDPNSNLFRSETMKTTKTMQVEKPQVVIPPTEHHPGQWTTLKETVIQGHWATTHLSGALPIPEKEALLEKVTKLRDAVKTARSRANDTEVEKKEVSSALLGYLFA
jgi:hypothetical protein